MTTSQRTGRRRVAVGAAAVLAVLCCAAPGLLAAGALAGLAATIGSPWFIGAAAALALAGGAGWLIRRATLGGKEYADACCSPADEAP